MPYKRHASESIEAAVAGDDTAWRRMSPPSGAGGDGLRRGPNYFLGCLASIAVRHNMSFVEPLSHRPESALLGIWHYVGDAPGWLERVVRSVANSNLWLHTRSAFCP